MLASSRHHREVRTKSCAHDGRFSRDGFLQALRLIGATGGVTYCHTLVGQPGTEEVHSGFLSCPRKVWVQAFGELENVVHREDPGTRSPPDAWCYECTDGPVTCVGHLFERCPDQEWMIVKKVTIQRMVAGQSELAHESAGPGTY